MSLLHMTYTLEKDDVYHREEANLKIYREHWLRSGRRGNFFYWLDHGDGRSVSLPACPRARLDQDRVTYIPDGHRKPFRVLVRNGRLVYKATGMPVSTRNLEDTIYVLSPKWKFYVHKKINMIFHHSSFMSGGDVYCAGHLHVTDGWVKTLSYTSGHYKPTQANFELVLQFLRNGNIHDLSEVWLTSS